MSTDAAPRSTVPTATGRTSSGRAPELSPFGLVALLLGVSLPMIDYFVVNVALPAMARDLRTTASSLELVVAGYAIAYAVLMVLGGRLGDAVGRRRMYLIGLAAFTVASLACGLAPTVGTLVAARLVQGATSAMMLPQVLSTIQATTTGRHRSRALGWYAAMGGFSMVAGQVLGGALVAADIGGTSWRPVFLINVPVGVAGLLLARRVVPETRSEHPVRIDRAGTVLLAVALLALLVPLTEGHAAGWPVWCWPVLAVAPLAAAGFVWVQRRAERAGWLSLLPPSLLRVPSMRRGLALAVPFFIGFAGFMFSFALTMQDGLRSGPLGAGLALLPYAVGVLVSSISSGLIQARFGRGALLGGSAVQGVGVLITAGSTLAAWPVLTHHPVLAPVLLGPGMVIAGLGQGVVMPVLFRAVLSEVPVEIAGAGSGALTTTQQTSLALGVAVLGGAYTTVTGAFGAAVGFAVVLAAQAVTAAVIMVAGRRLPDPRR